MTLTVRLLANFQISIDNTLLITLSPRLQALVAYVGLHRHQACSRRHLAATLWPETSDAQALKNLRTQLTRLRQGLPTLDQFMHINGETLQWRSDAVGVLDVARFETASQEATRMRTGNALEAIGLCESALQEYRGDLLPDWYDDWVMPLREQLHQQYAATLYLLSNLLEEQQRRDEAIAVAQRWVRADPLNEAAYGRLMALHIAGGDNSAAQRVFQASAAALRAGLDAVPGHLLQTLLRQAQEGATGSRMGRGGAPGEPNQRPGSDGSPSGVQTPAFVGRARELQLLLSSWDECLGGRAQVVAVTGEAGIGKTRLVEELLARMAAQGVAMATTRCFAGGEALAYAPLAELLRSEHFRPRLQQLEPLWASEVARLLPELMEGEGHAPPPGPLTETWQRQRFLQALTRLLLGPGKGENSGPQPTVILFDDLQWCDGESLGWLAYLLHAAANSPLLVLATMRSEDLLQQETLPRLLLAFQRAGQYRELPLGPLSAADTAVLAAHVGGRSLSQLEEHNLYRSTEGNPLFVVEFVRAWPGGSPTRQSVLPPKVQAVVRYRLAQLSAPARAAAQTAAVAGRDINLALLVRAGGQSEAEAATGLDELWRRQILRPTRQENYEFGHDQLRQVAYDAIGPQRRRFLHGQVAEALAQIHAANVETVAGRIAHHYRASNHPEQALPYYLAAAGAAARIFGNAEALHFYQQAQALLAPGDGRAISVLESQGELQRRQGNWQEAQRALRAALALVDEGDVLRRAALLNRLGRALIASHQLSQAADALTTARALLEATAFVRDEAWYTTWIAVLMGLVEWHYWGGSTDEMAHLVALLQPAVHQYGSRPQHMEWRQLAARMEFRRTRYVVTDAMVEEQRAAAELVARLGDPLELAGVRFGYGFSLLWNGRLEEATVQFREGLLLARQTGQVLLETQCLSYLAVIARLAGQLEEARNLTVLTLDSAEASQRLDYVGIAHANLAWLAWRAGNLAAARQHGTQALQDWEDAATGIPFRWLALWPLIGAALEENRVESAVAQAGRLLEDTQQPPPSSIRNQVSSALEAWQAGQGLQARAHLEVAVRAAAAIGHA